MAKPRLTTAQSEDFVRRCLAELSGEIPPPHEAEVPHCDFNELKIYWFTSLQAPERKCLDYRRSSMQFRVNPLTDIASIGVWDPEQDFSELVGTNYSQQQALLRKHADAGRLFLIDTGADGGFAAEVYLDEQPEHFAFYSDPADREFRVICESGRLVASGIESITTPETTFNPEENTFEVAPGDYALRFFMLGGEAVTFA